MYRLVPDLRLAARRGRLAAALGAVLLFAPVLSPPAAGHEEGGAAPAAQEPQEAAEAEAGKPAAGKNGDDEPWDVNAPRGPARQVAIDVDEGTWMSLDVAPDGREIVFDLLGDLYLLPIEGGEARALTSGHAWDMQPRFSPDGRWIAFTSDRGGGDNVWVVARDGADPAGASPRQVTDESFRLLNSPAWSPDGRWIAAHKHFTSTRSLGAGEIWLYHASGGKGLQATEKPNEQKDVGEPAFSPDGRYIYFSQDTTPGPVFQYNKDPNPGIYTIRRLDRETGEIVDLVGGAGGAVRPTPSPDGARLAFVRRVRAATVLWLKDLATGEEWPLWDGLDRDMQETWAIHGVYPGIAWTPDSAAVVAWAGGKIHRVDAATGAVTPIPFHVRAERTVVEPLRFPVAVAPERFDVRMLRWVTVSPAGDRVVYQALGKLWVKELPDGEPRPLTHGTPLGPLEFDHHPSFTRDGRWVVYTSWSDRDLGTVRVVPAAGGAGRALTAEPGHYHEPAVSPDGRWLVYRRGTGGGIVSPLHSDEPGIYRLPFRPEGGGAAAEPEKVTAEGVQPHFGADPDRVFVLRVGEKERTLVSLELDGSDERVHARSANAGRFRVSPDGRWLAWQERYQAYVAPFAATGRAVELVPKSEALPVTRVSRDAGDWLGWAGDSSALHWSLGPDLYRLPLADAFAFLAGEPPGRAPKAKKGKADQEEGGAAEDGGAGAGAGGEGGGAGAAGAAAGEGEGEAAGEGEAEDAEAKEDDVYAKAEVTPIGFQAATDRPAGTLALVGARIVTMAGADGGVIDDGVIVIERDRIRAVGRRGEVEVPAGAHVVDAAGKTIIPGLIDVHWHGDQAAGGVIPERNWVDHASLAFGVTTLHDPSSDTATVFAASEMAKAGLILAPRIFSTGTILYGAETPFMVSIDGLEDARAHLRRMKAVGAFSVKSYNQPRRDQRQQVLAAARELSMMVVPEGGSLFQHNMTMVVDGHTGVEHSLPVPRVYRDVLALWGATPVGYTPTLGVAYGGLFGETYWYAKTDVWAHPRLAAFVPREELDARARRRVLAPDEEWNHFRAARVAADLRHAGVPVQVGAHGQREGLAAHWELWMLVQGGMTPLEALAAGTIDAARYLGLDGDLGSIEPGKLADLAILGGDPLADIRRSDGVERVVLGGRLYDAATLDRLWPDPAPRAPYWWQRGGDGRLLLAPGRAAGAP
jgi:imidazolonepropionase-like amidohydrolase/Tol biopolymer transport system component